jgi:DNA-binding transcriptional LysR family regulator
MFQVVMRTRNLTAAARLLDVTQPAVSHALKELEAQIGFVLFHRSSGPLRPTPEAEALLPEIERLFAQVGSFRLRVDELRGDTVGHLSVASVPSSAVRLLPSAIAALRASRPGVRVKLLVNTVAEVAGRIKDEAVDLGFVLSPIEHTGIASLPLLDTRIVAYVPAAHPLAQAPVVSADSLAGVATIIPTQQTVPGQLLHSSLDSRTIAALDLMECNNASSALSMVSHGVGVALMDPLSLGAGIPSGVVCRPFEPAVAISVIAIHSRHRALSKAASEFVDHVRRAAQAEVGLLGEVGLYAALPAGAAGRGA